MLAIREATVCLAMICGTATWAADCNVNGVPDDVEIAAGSCEDCNSNWIPDECDVSSEVVADWMLQPSDPANYKRFGMTVDIWGDLAVVGAPNDSGLGDNAGAVYVFRMNTGTWIQEAKLTASDGGEDDLFGKAVAVSAETVVVYVSREAPAVSNVYVYGFDGTQWVEEAKLAEDTAAGNGSIDIWNDVMVVGVADSMLHGPVDVFRHAGSQWALETRLGDSQSGCMMVSLWDDVVAVSGVDAGEALGHVALYRYGGTGWGLESQIDDPAPAPGNAFGNSISVSGDLLVVGVPGEWVNGIGFAGAALVYQFDGVGWINDTKLTSPNSEFMQRFGTSVSGWDDRLLVSTWGDALAAPAYVYRSESSIWSLEAEILGDFPVAPYGTGYGYFASISGTTAIVGAPEDRLDGFFSGGLAYVFELGSDDYNTNGIPDECDVPGDLNGDGEINAGDMDSFTDCMGGPDTESSPSGLCSLTDMDQDDDVDLIDFGMLQWAVGS